MCDPPYSNRGVAHLVASLVALPRLPPEGEVGVRKAEMSSNVVEASVDWVTATCSADDARREMRLRGEALLAQEETRGNKTERWGRCGYIGVHSGDMFLGDRPDTTMVCLAGPRADLEYDWLAGLGGNLTRIDIAATVRQRPFDPDYAWRHYLHVKETVRTHRFAAGLAIHAQAHGGATLYVGARASRWYARLYDKAAQSHLPQYTECWRWEVEAKQEACAVVRRGLADPATRREWIASAVYAHFSERGINPDWDCHRVQLQDSPGCQRTDPESSLRWLRTTVRPIIDRWRRAGDLHRALVELGVELP